MAEISVLSASWGALSGDRCVEEPLLTRLYLELRVAGMVAGRWTWAWLRSLPAPRSEREPERGAGRRKFHWRDEKPDSCLRCVALTAVLPSLYEQVFIVYSL